MCGGCEPRQTVCNALTERENTTGYLGSPEAEQGRAVGGIGEDVQQAEDGERNDILDVILMSSSNPLNVLVGSTLKTFC